MTGEPVSHLHLEFLEEFRRGKGLVSICPCIQLASIENIESQEPTGLLGSRDFRGCSSAGRAPDLHSGGRRFDPDQLHQW